MVPVKIRVILIEKRLRYIINIWELVLIKNRLPNIEKRQTVLIHNTQSKIKKIRSKSMCKFVHRLLTLMLLLTGLRVKLLVLLTMSV